MDHKAYLIPLVLILSIVSYSNLYSQTNEEMKTQYKEEIENLRAGKDQSFMQDSISPLTSEQIKTFKGLLYYDIDYNYKITAAFHSSDGRETISLSTTDGNKKELLKYGTATFSINGKTFTLTIFKNNNLPEFGNDDQILFVPFSDLTTGNGSSDNGRYLEVEAPVENTIILDFNKAMNPYSAYNSDLFSVIPPQENAPSIIIETGERKYEDR